MFASGAGGSPSQRKQLREYEEQLLERRREADNKDRQIQQHTDRLVLSVGRRSRELLEREELCQELADFQRKHRQEIELQRQRLAAEHAQAVRQHLQLLDEEAHHQLEAHVALLESGELPPHLMRSMAASSSSGGDRGSGGALVPGCRCVVKRGAALYEEPDGDVALTELERGTVVLLLEMPEGEGWAKVACDEEEGWVSLFTEAGLPVLARSEEEVDPGGGASSALGLASSPVWALVEARQRLRSQVVEAEEANRRWIESEEQRAVWAHRELMAMRGESSVLFREHENEREAATVAHEAYLAECRAAQRREERLTAEVRSQVSETEALADEHRGLESQARAMQHELSKVVYTVGQRDQELKVKNSELQEVRQSLVCIQDEMDEVNRQLRQQCNRVQRVEGSLRLSRDLGEKVRVMRQMVKESHVALGQLCGLLEAERAKKDQCTQGLRQQRVRTELLLQLLHHFKSRTQDLSPNALLGLSGVRLELGADLVGATPAGSQPSPAAGLHQS